MVQLIQASGFWVFVMVMEFIQPVLAKNTVANGNLMFVMAKVDGLNLMDQ